MQAKDRQDDSATLSDANIELSKKLSYSVRRFYGGWNVTSELIDYEKELKSLGWTVDPSHVIAHSNKRMDEARRKEQDVHRKKKV